MILFTSLMYLKFIWICKLIFITFARKKHFNVRHPWIGLTVPRWSAKGKGDSRNIIAKMLLFASLMYLKVMWICKLIFITFARKKHFNVRHPWIGLTVPRWSAKGKGDSRNIIAKMLLFASLMYLRLIWICKLFFITYATKKHFNVQHIWIGLTVPRWSAKGKGDSRNIIAKMLLFTFVIYCYFKAKLGFSLYFQYFGWSHFKKLLS